MIDLVDGNNRLAKIARTLKRAEEAAAGLALMVLDEGAPTVEDRASVEVAYPVEFDLYTAADVASSTADFQAILARAGVLPETEGLLMGRLVRLCLPGMSDLQYARCEEEIRGYLGNRAGGTGGTVGAPQEPYSSDVHRW